jgi:hypothetical protein
VPAHPIQPGFVAGELSPQGYGREDFQKYAFGAELIRNAVVKPFGGAARRAGTYFITEVNDSSKLAILQPFIFSQTQAYILEMQQGTIRFFRNRALILGEGTGAELVTNGGFATDLAGWTITVVGTGAAIWDASTRADLTGGAAGSVTLAQAITVVPGSTYIVSFNVLPSGLGFQVGTANGLADILALMPSVSGTRTVAFTVPTGVTTAWIQFGHNENVSKFIDNVSAKLAGPLVLNGSPTTEGAVPPWTEADLRELRYTQINDVLYIFHRDYPTHKLLRLSDVEWTLQVVAWTPPPSGEIREYPDTTITLSATTGAGITITTGTAYWLTGDVGKIVQVGAGRAHIVSFTSSTIVNANVIDAFASVGPIVPGAWSTFGSPGQTLTPSVASPVGAASTLTAGGDAFRVTDLGKFVRVHGGLVYLTVFTSATVMAGEIVVPLSATSIVVAGAWLLESPLWSASLGYPECGVRFEGRLVVGRDDTFWGSQPGDYENFAKGSDAGTAYEFPMSTEINRMRWMAAARSLLLGTIGNEISARGPTDTSISPESVPRIITEGNAGSDVTCAPVQVGNTLLMVTRSGRKLLELVYSFEEDGQTAHDMTILVDHLFAARTILQMARMSEPEQIVFAVGSDGVLLTFAYNRRENIIAWSRQVTGTAQDAVDGQFESVAVIPSMCGTADEVWVVVKRVLTSGTQRYVEVFDGALNTDCARTYAGTAIDVLTGLDHLEGDTATLVRDGVADTAVVTSGDVTLDTAAVAVEAGLPFTTTLRTLRLSLPTARGTSQGQKKRMNEVIVRFLCAGLGWKVDGELVDTHLRPSGEIVQDFRREMRLGVDREARVTITQTQPFAGTVLAVMPSVGVEDG